MLDLLSEFVYNYGVILLLVSSVLAMYVLLQSAKRVYNRKVRVSWWKILIIALISSTYIQLAVNFISMPSDSLLVQVIVESISTFLCITLLGYTLQIHKSKDYLHFIISFYFTYLVIAIINYGGLSIFLGNAKADFIGLAYVLWSYVYLLVASIVALIISKSPIPNWIERIAEYKTIATLVLTMLFIDTIVIAKTYKETLVIMLNAEDALTHSIALYETALAMIVLLGLNVVLFAYATYMLMNLDRVKQQENELMQQNLYIQKLENLQTETRMFRHDYKNMLAGMYVQAQSGDISSVQEYLSEVVNHLDESIGASITASSQLSKIKVTQMKSSILVKLMELEEARISYRIEIPNEITNLSMKASDFARCFGILIDNAKEAVGQDGSMSIVFLQEDHVLHVLVKNNMVKNLDIAKIWEEGYSSKGNGRGFGLASYQRILDRYSNILKRTKLEDETIEQSFSVGY